MEHMYGFHSSSSYTLSPENNLISPLDNSSVNPYWPFCGSDDLLSVAASVITDATAAKQIILPRRRLNRQRNGVVVGYDDDNNIDDDDDASGDRIKEKIAAHPSFFKLLDAYIDCQKVGAPPELACLLDGIPRENEDCKRNATASTCLGFDTELDEFMESFWLLLVKYKSEITRPFDEASVFFDNIETQLRHFSIDEGGISSEEEGGSRGETGMSQELKDTLLRKFGGRISSLKHEFTKKKKRGKLPKEARITLLDWWTSHHKWPYPTEGDKISLAETTGLDPKQINNWFINQRKRHWKPSENMHLAIMGGLQALPGEYMYDD